MNLIERLKQLEAKATPGPWKPIINEESGRVSYIEPSFGAEHCHWDGWYISANSVDGKLVAEMRNALPKLLAVVQAASSLAESAITQADILEDGTIIPTKCRVCPEAFSQLQEALAALEEDV